VLTGGDPSTWKYLDEVKRCGLWLEIHTNAHVISTRVFNALLQADMIGLSLDGVGSQHNTFRNATHDNYQRKLDLQRRFFDAKPDLPVTVRTIISGANADGAFELAPIIASMPNVTRWSLSRIYPGGRAVGDWERWKVFSHDFSRHANRAAEPYRTVGGEAAVEVYGSEDEEKEGHYVFVGGTGSLPVTNLTSLLGGLPSPGELRFTSMLSSPHCGSRDQVSRETVTDAINSQ